MTHRIYQMSFKSVFEALIAKAERKERTAQEVFQLTSWLTGYSLQEIKDIQNSNMSYGDFFKNAPELNPKRVNVTGKICGVQIETIENPIMQDIRCLDRLVDWLARGKSLKDIFEKYDF
ncbi:hypothetical protein HMPREF9318_00379 [Streptococcus urinalis FB127-CNA-2]|uniref:Lin0147 n=1 Tax=Streptococcus urinalis 2285-97 TaxID=764291 RepID=G5KFX1_9STRE|nr:DUF2200 family protein [Streptococcus urinalis]EHJ57509.1 hypothetical protein STRUR_1130 [Streptococcus urinalis 2285-97]EKS22181.1 hypothetical protein HMPREF9318_00379 [Streptococcus urinalis FB127-CNA-2]VEF31993.1 Lin0147 [Streptococcus urinalis]